MLLVVLVVLVRNRPFASAQKVRQSRVLVTKCKHTNSNTHIFISYPRVVLRMRAWMCGLWSVLSVGWIWAWCHLALGITGLWAGAPLVVVLVTYWCCVCVTHASGIRP